MVVVTIKGLRARYDKAGCRTTKGWPIGKVVLAWCGQAKSLQHVTLTDSHTKLWHTSDGTFINSVIQDEEWWSIHDEEIWRVCYSNFYIAVMLPLQPSKLLRRCHPAWQLPLSPRHDIKTCKWFNLHGERGTKKNLQLNGGFRMTPMCFYHVIAIEEMLQGSYQYPPSFFNLCLSIGQHKIRGTSLIRVEELIMDLSDRTSPCSVSGFNIPNPNTNTKSIQKIAGTPLKKHKVPPKKTTSNWAPNQLSN